MNEQSLLPCPFCGSAAKIDRERNYHGIVILCGNKECPVRPEVELEPVAALKAWNNRHTSAIPNLWGDLSALVPKKNEQLEKDIESIQGVADFGVLTLERQQAIARTILHLLKR